MSPDPVLLDADSSLADCARVMADRGIGFLGVLAGGELSGTLTDRDIVVRAIARDRDPKTTTAGDCCTGDPVTIAPDASLEEAERTMADRRVRRLLVVEDGDAVGVVSIDDIARERQPESVQAQQTAAIEEARLLRGDQGYTGQAE